MKMWRLWWLYQWQSVQKLILGEGEKFVMLGLNGDEQAVYYIATNLGKL
jgi:hypothetical protein